MDGNLFRGSKSTSPIDEAPPRDSASIKRYAQHLPFQVFCCESGVHIIDPSQSFYQGISYRSSIEHGIFNISAAEDGKAPKWSEGPCMDSAQMHFCRDLWMLSAREGVIKDARKAHERERKGLNRGLSDEMEKIVKTVAPQYAPSDKSSGGYLGYFGRKKPITDDAASKNADADDWDDEDEEEDEEDSSSDENSASTADKKKDGDNKKEGEDGKPVIVVPEKKEKQETEAEKEVKKEKAMAAEAAAAALPVEEQHPPEGVDAGAAIKADDNSKEGADKKAAANKGEKPQSDGDVAVDAEKEEQFVDPEAMLALEAEKLAQQAEAGADKPKKKLAKRAAAANEERAEAPAAANPAVQNNKDDPAKKKVQPPSVNNPDESDELDNKAPPPVKVPPASSAPASNAPSSGGGRAGRALRNNAFEPARIIINPRCVTTYAGVSHTQLALDLFGNTDEDDDSLLSLTGSDRKSSGKGSGSNNALLDDEEEDDDDYLGGGLGGRSSSRISSKNDKYALHEFGPAAETFVCQEMRTSGGRSAPKQQRRTGFSIARGLAEGWQPRRR